MNDTLSHPSVSRCNQDLARILGELNDVAGLVEEWIHDHDGDCKCVWCSHNCAADFIREELAGALWGLRHGATAIDSSIFRAPVALEPATVDEPEVFQIASSI